ncbi:hypothetical protein [[Actinomadura] parvosata]|nr:hypothetical protein [Nonomuraea sp. ATCC 55076]
MSDLVEPSGAPNPGVWSAADVLGFDPFDREFLRDPYSRHREMSAPGALFRTRAGLLVATSHELCATLPRGPRLGRGPGGRNGGDAGQPAASVL